MNDHDDDLPPWGDEETTQQTKPTGGMRGRRVGKLTLLTDKDAQNATPRDYYLKGLISPAEMSVIYGEPGCGKSFFALYLARAIAQDRRVFGKRVHQTNVVFLALEGVTGFENRLRAQIITTNEADGFFYIAQPINLFSDKGAQEDVIQAVGLTGAGLLVIDTLNRALADGSENDPADMGRFIQSIDAIRAATGCHVMIIHHCGKDQGRGMRGHSSLLGAADVVLEVAKGTAAGQPRTVIVPKAKDDPDGSQFGFFLDVLEMGEDQDGDPITTCVVRECDDENAPKIKKGKISGAAKLALDQLRNCLIDLGVKPAPEHATPAGVTCVTYSQWKKYLEKTKIINADGNAREEIKRIRVTLGSAGYIGVSSEHVWIVT